jgi:hypothetical protein
LIKRQAFSRLNEGKISRKQMSDFDEQRAKRTERKINLIGDLLILSILGLLQAGIMVIVNRENFGGIWETILDFIIPIVGVCGVSWWRCTFYDED